MGDSLRTPKHECFDIIVSNPPWGAELEGWTPEEIVNAFPDCGEEKDSYALFLILAHRLLKDGGIVSYIMPNSWQTTIGYERFRRWMLANFDVLEVVNVWKIFQDVNHDACIVVLKKRPKEEEPSQVPTKVRSLATGGTEGDKCGRLAEEKWKYDFTVDAQSWAKEPGARFETIYEPRLAKMLDRVVAKGVPLYVLKHAVLADGSKNGIYIGVSVGGPQQQGCFSMLWTLVESPVRRQISEGQQSRSGEDSHASALGSPKTEVDKIRKPAQPRVDGV